MWIPRTAEETAKWKESATKEAHTHALFVAGLAWAAISALFSAGWFASAFGLFVSQNLSGNFWVRLPLAAVILSPFAWLVFRRKRASEIEKSLQMTICPNCDTASTGNNDSVCECGGTVVLQSSVKWVDVEIEKIPDEVKI